MSSLLSPKTTKQIQMLCCSALTVPMGWYLFWLSNDIFVWHKPLVDTNLTNLFGFLICAAVILAFAKFDLINIVLSQRVRSKEPEELFQTDAFLKLETQREYEATSEYSSAISSSSNQESKSLQTLYEPEVEAQINEDTQFEPPMQTPKQADKPQICPAADCDCYEFLQQRAKSKEIPNQCLTCNKLLDCLSKTGSSS